MKTSLAFACLLLACAPASAQLVSVDYLTPGDGALTRDYRTGLEWLDVPLTLGRGYEGLLTELLPGGMFAGFRFASQAEFTALHTSFGLPISYESTPESRDPAMIERSLQLQALLGYITPPFDPANYTAYLTSGYLDSSEIPQEVPTHLHALIQVLDFTNPFIPDYYRAEAGPVEPTPDNPTPTAAAFSCARSRPSRNRRLMRPARCCCSFSPRRSDAFGKHAESREPQGHSPSLPNYGK